MDEYYKREKFWNDLKSGKFASMVKETIKGRTIKNSLEVYNLLKPIFAQEDDIEKVIFIFLDNKNQVISIEKMFEGTINRAAVYPREIIKRIISLKANACIMVHNHTSGSTEPSEGDIIVTAKVFIAMSAIDAIFYDHIIIGYGFYSMRDSGCLNDIVEKVKLLLDYKL